MTSTFSQLTKCVDILRVIDATSSNILQVFVLMQFDPGMEYRPGWGDGKIIFGLGLGSVLGVNILGLGSPLRF